MRRFILLAICFNYFLINGITQTISTGINYQAVARDKDGNELVNQWLEVQFSILSSTPNGSPEWEELHTGIKTNNFGLFTVIIGQGTRSAGTFAKFEEINWGSAIHFLNVKVKLNQEFIDLGTTQLMWVPYALYALKAGSGETSSPTITYNSTTHKLFLDAVEVADLSDLYNDGSNAIQNLSLEGNNLIYSKNGQNTPLELSKFMDNTDSQTLSASGNTLSISGGNAVNFDSDAANEIQVLTLDGSTIKIHRPGSQQIDGSVSLPDLYEENDTLYIKGYSSPKKISLKHNLAIPKANQVSLSRGNTIYVDTDTTNEIQDLTLNADVLKITGKQAPTAVDLSPYKDNTDNQSLTFNETSKTLSITNGNSVNVENFINTPWVGFSSNNLSNQALLSSAETLITWSEEWDDGNCLDNNSFIATNSGVYNISLNLLLMASGPSVKIYKNTTTLIRIIEGSGTAISHNMLLKLNAGDTITVKILSNLPVITYLISGYFSGYRVH